MIFDRRLGILLGILFLCGGLGYYFQKTNQQENSGTAKNWVGDWKIKYHYENAPDLIFDGILHIDMENKPVARIQIWPPKSRDREILEIQNLVIDGDKLNGEIVHDTYKIKGGHPSENIELALTNSTTLLGTGKCTAYCAEGTEGENITWSGERSD